MKRNAKFWRATALPVSDIPRLGKVVKDSGAKVD
jgi:hypothetical protein